MPIKLIVFLIIATTVRLFLALLFPLTADESYYWLWSKHLALSYVDHPPLIAYLNYFFTLGQPSLFGLRLGATLLTLFISLGLFFLARKLFNEQVAVWSVVLFQIIPHYLIIWLTMFVELPLGLFWIISLWLMARIIKSKEPVWWLWLGLAVGLGCLSKYTMFLFWPCLAIFFYLAPAERFWLKRKEFYFSLILSLILFLPVLVWNAQHGWISFTFHEAKATSDAWGINFLPFIGDQLVHFTPFFLFALFPSFLYALKKDDNTRFLFSFSFPLLILFLILSLKIKIWSHWPSTAYLAALPLFAAYFLERKKSLNLFISWISSFSLIVLAILFWVTPGILSHQQQYYSNQQIAAKIPAGLKVFAGTNVTASLLEFYADRPTYLATGFLKPHAIWGEKQYELWGIPNLTKGETVIYFGEDTFLLRENAAKYFGRVVELPDLKLSLIEDYITSNYKFFRLEDYKENGGHP